MYRQWRVCFVCILLIQAHGYSSADRGNTGAKLRVSNGALNNAVSGQMKGKNSQNNLNMPAMGSGGGDLVGGLVGGLLGGGGGGGGGLLGGVLGGGNGGGLLGGVLGGGEGGGGGLLGGLLGGGGGGGGGGGLLGGILGGSGGGGLLGGILGGGGGGGNPPGYTDPHINGGILGNGGLLGGLLGGGLLGILGNGGLLGTVQGITGLRIIDLTLPQISLRLLPGIGVHLNLYTKVAINGNSLLGFLDIMAEVNITARTRLTQESSGVPRLVIEDCQALLGGINIRLLRGLLSGILDGLLTNLLRNILPGVLCPVVNIVLDLTNGLLLTVNSLVPLGLIGSIQYTVSSLPIVTGQFIELDLNTVVSQLGGGLIDYPLGHKEQITLPPMKDASESQLGLSANFLACVLTALQKEGLMDIEISSGDVPGVPPLTTTAIGGVIPKVAAMYKEERPLLLKITVSDPPVVKLQNKKGLVKLFVQTEILVSNADSSETQLCILGVDAQFGASFSVYGDKLKITMSVDSTHLSIVSTSIGKFDVSILEGLVGTLFNLAFLPSINTVLGSGIPLPQLMGLDFNDSDIDILDNLIVLNA
ncbi:BPI fold-containing family B member 4-like isoform X1 [Bufo gargarizans]|uniref:BPI fold-containing family B member 4-like isoform X1 n=1 Tax=Bufo gargarizans TaxID=30331 RepID=UPI001CF4329F|nr:BPI fold-containing family B member 4-like isoform X1 [Bufo gargarizans]XP_044155172.1 BPI fold-containing family B member 4-like isoform X1 [Bufo gargarizans]